MYRIHSTLDAQSMQCSCLLRECLAHSTLSIIGTFRSFRVECEKILWRKLSLFFDRRRKGKYGNWIWIRNEENKTTILPRMDDF